MIAPGNTAVVYTYHSEIATWDVPEGTPQLELGNLRPSLAERASRRLVRLAGGRPGDYADWSLGRFMRRTGVRVVLSEWLTDSLRYFDLCRSLDVRFYAHAHGYDSTLKMLSDPQRQAQYRVYADAAGVITVSQLQKDRLASMVGIPAEKIHVRHPGIDVPEAPPKHPARDTIKCLAVGRMLPKKAPLETLEAFANAYRAEPRLRLDYIGEGPLMDVAIKYVQEHDLGEVVHLLGAQPADVTLGYFRASDLYILHSIVDPGTGDEEGLPSTILEAMASGIPVVSTLHAGIPEAVAHGETGFLVQEGDVDAMAEYILNLARDADLRAAVGRKGWEVARERYSSDKCAARLREVLGLN